MTRIIKHCPFCGVRPEIEKWHGGSASKKAVSCPNDFCAAMPMVTGRTEAEAVRRWNRRKADGR